MSDPAIDLQPGTRRLTIAASNRERNCLVHVPERSIFPTPVVLMLHGAGGTGLWAADETGWSDKAEREGFIAAYPEALPPRPGKPSKFLTNPPRWNDGSLRGTTHPVHDDSAFLRSLLEALRAHPAIDQNRIFVTGFSNGAGMAFRLAADCADWIAAISPVAGHCWIDEPQPVRPVPTVYLTGEEDPLIPMCGGRVRTPWGWVEEKPSVAATLGRWAKAIGCATEPNGRVQSAAGQTLEYSGAGGDGVFRAELLAGLGHHWPGGRGGLGAQNGGPFVPTLSATDAIWDFFLAHSLRG